MNDRELLEMAAKAAGYDHDHKINRLRLELYPPVNDLWVSEDGELFSTGWNPLTDDGDALRLAVGLDILFSPVANSGDDSCARVRTVNRDVFLGEPHGDDKYAATRRAIVRAAAEIGKAMP